MCFLVYTFIIGYNFSTMKKQTKLEKSKIIGIILAAIAVLCLIAGIVLLCYSLPKHIKLDSDSNSQMSSSAGSINETSTDSADFSGNDADSALEQIDSGLEAADSESGQAASESNQAGSGNNDTAEAIPEPTRIDNPYKDYFLQNEDMAAWLYIPDTVINYPVMYTPFDENYYLNRDFNKNSNANGCLILDTDSSVDPLSTNLIIHGHNMGSGAMFGTLTRYENETYCNEHKYIYLYDKDYEHIYEVIAVFRSKVYYKTDVAFKYYKFFNATTQEEFDDFYENIKALSVFDTGVTAEFGDKFITLSTCAYHVDNGRFVVVAKEIKPGDYYLPIE